jgi:hypothetical protein
MVLVPDFVAVLQEKHHSRGDEAYGVAHSGDLLRAHELASRSKMRPMKIAGECIHGFPDQQAAPLRPSMALIP